MSIGSGTTATVAAAMGDNSSGDFSDAFGEEELSFAMGGGHRQCYRKKAVTTKIGSGTTTIESGSNGGNKSSAISLMRFGGDELSFTKWGERVSDFLKFNLRTYWWTNPSVIA